MRGYQKRVVFVRNPNSRLFDEAYFVLRDEELPPPQDKDMVAEATRIIEGERAEERRHTEEKGRLWRRALIGCGCFFLGVISTLGAVALLYIR